MFIIKINVSRFPHLFQFERLELEHEQQRVMTSKVYAETEAKERRLREEYAEKVGCTVMSLSLEPFDTVISP